MPEIYYDYMRGIVTRDELFSHPELKIHAERARHEAWNKTLSLETHDEVTKRVESAIGTSDFWVLIGGPPCQAYSLVGRSRMRADGVARFERDSRHFLYREYLRILRDHLPPVFIMENVKGLLSATHGKTKMFEMILDDLSMPQPGGPRYRIVPFCGSEDRLTGTPRDYVVRAERFGIPQTRHRVILCGIREDITHDPARLTVAPPPSVSQMLAGLPLIRSRLSKESDSQHAWLSALAEARDAVARLDGPHRSEIISIMDIALAQAKSRSSFGSTFLAQNIYGAESAMSLPQSLREWLDDPSIEGITSHDSRSHMRKDLHRYFYAASFAQATGYSPNLRDFPASMLPDHANAKRKGDTAPFKDRFHVQQGDRPSSTIVSHISKDGHYFIHSDPSQCRSLTVREAARLQTFPDNYHFEGNRTQQFVQVGNAVPPYLAAKIAASTYRLAID